MSNEEEQEKLAKEGESRNESSPFVSGKEAVSSDDIIEELTRKRNWRYTAMIMSLMLVWMGGPASVYLTSFAGYQKYYFAGMRFTNFFRYQGYQGGF